MRLKRILRGCAIALATVGIALPHGTAMGAGMESPAATAKRQAARVADVALAPGGVLQGQVLTAQGVAKQDVTVSIQQNGREIARVRTDKQGVFAASGLKGGTYLVATDGAIGPVRAWTHNTAPPAASTGILLVPQGETALGQLNSGSLLTNPGVLITAAFIGTIIAVAVAEDAS